MKRVSRWAPPAGPAHSTEDGSADGKDEGNPHNAVDDSEANAFVLGFHAKLCQNPASRRRMRLMGLPQSQYFLSRRW